MHSELLSFSIMLFLECLVCTWSFCLNILFAAIAASTSELFTPGLHSTPRFLKLELGSGSKIQHCCLGMIRMIMMLMVISNNVSANALRAF